MNLYSYVGQDPINWVDPSGLLRSGRNKPKNRHNTDGLTTGWEVHVIVGVGEFDVRCCDPEWNEKVTHTYRKICLGAALDISYGVAATSGTGGKSCSNPPKRLLGGELGALIVEGGVSVDMDGSGASGTGGGTLGGGIGGVKATGCFYFYMKTTYSGETCCE